MNDHAKHIQDWQDRVRSSFGDSDRLYHYLFETMYNFYYRYLETSSSKGLKTQELAPQIWGAYSFESSMVEALKIKDPDARSGIMTLAKTVAPSQSPSVRYGLWAHIKELTLDGGSLTLVAEVNWGHPTYTEEEAKRKVVEFQYTDLGQFRKELALKLEEVCELFCLR